ncbi:MAG: CDP-glycerol glycerophosphotransferase family protein [Saccharofermentans sp.]|nr:CDP-glycerol glycerophosphotransferase family protein [Saccharofermentans sp.]
MSLYIDPGTGSMLFTIAIGVVSVAVFFFRSLLLKLKFLVSREKVNIDKDHQKFAIFSDSKHYWNTFEPICDEFEKRGIEITFYTAAQDDPALSKDYKYVKCVFAGKGNATYSRMNLLKADILLSTTPNLDVYQWKRSRNVKYYVHIFHAISDPSLYKMFSLDAYDAVLNIGPVFEKQIRKLEELRNQPNKEIVNMGLPYVDSLFARKKSTPDIKNDTPVVLLAPSWNTNAILARYGSPFIKALVDTGYHIIIRPHPQSFKSEKEMIDRLMSEFPNSDKLEWNRDNDNFDVLNRSDILISDFSGVIMDYYLVFNKPFIYADFDFDSSQYDAYWLKDDPTWLLSTIRKIGSPIDENYSENIKSIIDKSLNNTNQNSMHDEVLKQGLSNLGTSAKHTVDYLINKQKELTEEK